MKYKLGEKHPELKLYRVGDEWFAEWAGMARAAIAKAKGEE